MKRKHNPLLSYRLSEDPVGEYIEKFTSCHAVKMETVSFVFDRFCPPASAIFAFDIVEIDREKQQNGIHINNFFVGPQIRNMGVGTKLLKHMAKKMAKFNRKTKYTTVSICGMLDAKDLSYWKFSLPMYYSFAKRVIGPKVLCLINNEPVESDKLVSTAYNKNSQNISVGFEFRF